MARSCTDICELLTQKLIDLGFEIDQNNQDHRDIYDALGEVQIARWVERDIPNTDQILAFAHCGQCLQEVLATWGTPEPASASEYARLSVGMTDLGFQVWCVRHQVNVCHVDFQGMKHPANTSRKEG